MYSYFIRVKPKEHTLVAWSFLYFFVLLASYFILRPLRDEMGISNGSANMQWLFTGTFLTMIIIVPIFGYFTSRYKIGTILKASYLFFISNILIFYYSFTEGIFIKALPIFFFIWLSVFNLFAISLFWSFMVDIYTNSQSKRLFGIISAGGSLGAITGPLLATTISTQLGIAKLFLVTVVFLLISLISLLNIMRINEKSYSKQHPKKFYNYHLIQKTVFDGIKLVMTSGYLKKIVLFMILYTCTSTFLYFEQATIVEQTIHNRIERIRYFSTVDLITNLLAVIGQFFFTDKIIKQFGLSFTLSMIPFILAIGFLVLGTKTTLPVLVTLLVILRAGNYTTLKPGREILFTVNNREVKYKAKNFIDTAVYRGGDAFSGWLFSMFVSMGIGLSAIALIAIPIVILWGYTGFQLGNQEKIYKKPENTI